MYKSGSFLDRVHRLFWLILAVIIRPFVKVRRRRICCWAYHYTQYSCNPMYLTEYILKNDPSTWDIFWILKKEVDISRMDKRINVVHPFSLKGIYALYSSEFIFNNCRSDIFSDLFIKKNGQKYIMTWHGSTPLKKIEKDALQSLPRRYYQYAKRDSKMCDLMLSNCQYFTNIIKNSFWYDGPILMKGIPRNDIYFDKDRKVEIRKMLIQDNKIPTDAKIILYAPTFRSDNDVKPFKLNWNRIIESFEGIYKCPIIVFLRLHPNSIGLVNVNELITDKRIIDMCLYKDMQELLCISDLLITDYSSTMFEMGLQEKVCLIYAPDINKYDRGFYFNLKSLPFPLAKNETELIDVISKFDELLYKQTLMSFNNKYLQLVDSGKACQELLSWMSVVSIQ